MQAARFLCRIYQTGLARNPHSVLAGITGMSVSGICKLVMSLRRRSVRHVLRIAPLGCSSIKTCAFFPAAKPSLIPF